MTAACGNEPEAAPDAAPSSSEPTRRPARAGQLAHGRRRHRAGADASSLADIAEDLANENRGTIEPRNEPVQGADVSWPQCPPGMGIPEKQGKGLPMPVDEAEFVVFGLTNGPGFTPNPCLADQVAWAAERELMTSAYAVASYPDDETLKQYGVDGPFSGDSLKGRLRNTGYQQARFNIGTMVDAGLPSPVVWIDVEPVPLFEWSANHAANAAVVEGLARAYTDAGLRSASTRRPYLWETRPGRLLAWAECRSGGPRGRPPARKRSTAAGRTGPSRAVRRSSGSGSPTTATTTSPAPASRSTWVSGSVLREPTALSHYRRTMSDEVYQSGIGRPTTSTGSGRRRPDGLHPGREQARRRLRRGSARSAGSPRSTTTTVSSYDRGRAGVRRAQPLPLRARPPDGLPLPAHRRLHRDDGRRRPSEIGRPHQAGDVHAARRSRPCRASTSA